MEQGFHFMHKYKISTAGGACKNLKSTSTWDIQRFYFGHQDRHITFYEEDQEQKNEKTQKTGTTRRYRRIGYRG